MLIQKIAPAPVTERGGLFGGRDNVGEENGRKHRVGGDRRSRARQKLPDQIDDFVAVVADPLQMVGAWKLDIARARNVRRQETAALHVDRHVVRAMNDERGHTDRDRCR